MKKFALCAIALLLLFSMTSCSLFVKDETFTVKEVLSEDEQTDDSKTTFTSVSITLSSDFKQYDPLPIFGNYSAIFDSSKAKIMIKNEEITEYNDVTAYEYALRQTGGSAYVYPVEYDVAAGIVSYRYNSQIFGSKFSGVCYIFRESGDFWIIDMACRPDDIEDMLPSFDEWARSVTFEQCPMYDYIVA